MTFKVRYRYQRIRLNDFRTDVDFFKMLFVDGNGGFTFASEAIGNYYRRIYDRISKTVSYCSKNMVRCIAAGPHL